MLTQIVTVVWNLWLWASKFINLIDLIYINKLPVVYYTYANALFTQNSIRDWFRYDTEVGKFPIAPKIVNTVLILDNIPHPNLEIFVAQMLE